MRTGLLLASLALACGPRPGPADGSPGEEGAASDARMTADPARDRDAAPTGPESAPDLPVALDSAAALDSAVPGPDLSPSPDAAADARAGGCPFALCEDFEGVAAGTPPEPKLWSRTGNILVEAAPGGRPGQAMHVRAGATPMETYISQTRTLPALGEAFFARVRLFIASRPVDFFHWSFTEARGKDLRGTVVRYGGISVGCQPGMFCRDSFFFQIKPLVYGPDEGGSASDDFTPVIPERKWICLEWYLNSRTSEARLWWDGEERPRAHYLAGKPIPFPAFDRFYLGWALYQTGASAVPWEVWFDDLAIADRRVGCD